MGLIKTIQFSELIGYGWLDKKEIFRPNPKFSDIHKKYKNVIKQISNLKKDNENYIICNIIKYGVENYNANANEYCLKIKKYGCLTCQNDTIYLEKNNEYIQCVNNLSIDEQMEIIEQIQKHVSNINENETIKML